MIVQTYVASSERRGLNFLEYFELSLRSLFYYQFFKLIGLDACNLHNLLQKNCCLSPACPLRDAPVEDPKYYFLY